MGAGFLGGAKDLIFPMSCSFSKNLRQCSIMLRISDRLGARGAVAPPVPPSHCAPGTPHAHLILLGAPHSFSHDSSC